MMDPFPEEEFGVLDNQFPREWTLPTEECDELRADYIKLLQEFGSMSDRESLEKEKAKLPENLAGFESRFFHDFKITRLLGAGTYGCVFEAESLLDFSKYAVKRIQITSNENTMQHAIQEIREISQFDHSGIIRCNSSWIESPPEGWQRWSDDKMMHDHYEKHRSLVRDVTYNDSFIYIQMQLGKYSLNTWMGENKSQSSRQLPIIKRWFEQILSAIAYIHDQGFIHRNLKPSNILFVQENVLKICDMGIAGGKSMNGRCYASPEQLSSLCYSSKTDIFSLGLIFVELCVAMTTENAKKIFDDFRSGSSSHVEEHVSEEVNTIITWLTKVSEVDRPKCNEILKISFFQKSETEIMIREKLRRLEEEISLLKTQMKNSINSSREEFTSKFSTEYTVSEILGIRGSSCVFKAVNNFNECAYAVKRIVVDPNDKMFDKRLIAVHVMARLDHPGIIRYNYTWLEKPPVEWQYEVDNQILNKLKSKERQLLNYKADSFFIYISMQLCKYSLTEWLNQNSTQESRALPRMKSWFKQIVDAVDYIHEQGLMHRDLKPANILFLEKDRLKICDVGIVVEQELDGGEETMTISRTKDYSSPEQESWIFDSKSDVFALGLIFAELCVVMNYDTKVKIFDNYRRGKPSNIFEMDGRTAAFISKLTDANPKKRPTCREMLNDFYLS